MFASTATMKKVEEYLKEFFQKMCGNIFREREAIMSEINNLPDYEFKSMFHIDKE